MLFETRNKVVANLIESIVSRTVVQSSMTIEYSCCLVEGDFLFRGFLVSLCQVLEILVGLLVRSKSSVAQNSLLRSYFECLFIRRVLPC